MEPDDIDALLERASRLLEAGEPDQSLECLDQLELDSLDSETRIEWASMRAWALTELTRDEEALETLEPLLDEFPHTPRLLSTLGVVLSNCDELEEAREALEEALTLNPKDEVAVANLALVYEKLHDCERALALYDQALKLGADVDWVLEREASTLADAGRFDEAKTRLKRYLSLHPDHVEQWITLGILHTDDAEFAAAMSCYEQAEQVEPNSASLRLNWGVTAVRAHEFPVARKQLRLLQRIEPRSTRPWLLRAFILEEQGHLTPARVIYERLLTRTRFGDWSELAYAFEMAMDFFARHKLRAHCERLLTRAYAANACTVDLCEAYREITGEHVETAYWFSVVIEADYRAGLEEVHDREDPPRSRFTRFSRAFQVVARNHDDAVGVILDFVRRMGEKHPVVREFVGEESIEDTCIGLYEVETDSFVFADDAPA